MADLECEPGLSDPKVVLRSPLPFRIHPSALLIRPLMDLYLQKYLPIGQLQGKPVLTLVACFELSRRVNKDKKVSMSEILPS